VHSPSIGLCCKLTQAGKYRSTSRTMSRPPRNCSQATMPVTRSQLEYARFHQGVADVTDDVGMRSCFDQVSVLQQLFDCSIDLSPESCPCQGGVRMRSRSIGGHLAILLKPEEDSSIAEWPGPQPRKPFLGPRGSARRIKHAPGFCGRGLCQPSSNFSKDHSRRSASIGWTEAARRAGAMQASRAAAQRTTRLSTQTEGSRGFTS